MTDEIVLPFSTPGAQAGAQQVDALTNSTKRLLDAQKEMVVAEERATRVSQAAARAAEERIALLKLQTAETAKANAFYKASDQDEGGLSHKAQNLLIRRLPGGHLIHGAETLERGGAGVGLVAGFVGVTLAAEGLHLAFESLSKSAENQREEEMDKLKSSQEYAKSMRAAAEELEKGVAGNVRTMRAGARTLFARVGGPSENAELTIKDAVKAGGPEAVNALGALYETRRSPGSRSKLTPGQLLDRVQKASDASGLDVNEILQGLGKQHGAANISRLLRDKNVPTSMDDRKDLGTGAVASALKIMTMADAQKFRAQAGQLEGTTDIASGFKLQHEDAINPETKARRELVRSLEDQVETQDALAKQHRKWFEIFKDVITFTSTDSSPDSQARLRADRAQQQIKSLQTDKE